MAFNPFSTAGGGSLAFDTSSTATSGPIGGSDYSFGGLNVNSGKNSWAWPTVAVVAFITLAVLAARR